jgi:hypothetical protein
MGIGFWVIGLITLLIMKTQDYKYILLLSIYGMEVVLTIMERLLLKENIFEAHRRHLYQLLPMKKKVSHLLISFVYAFSADHKYSPDKIIIAGLDEHSYHILTCRRIVFSIKMEHQKTI